jgi:signal transduction histidine kinase
VRTSVLTRFARARTAGERYRSERLLAIARVLLVSGGLLAAWFGGVDPEHHSRLVLTLLAIYWAESVVVAASLRFPVEVRETLPLLLYSVDLVGAAALTLLTSGPASPFFVLWLFVLVSAAFRWGLRETLLTGVIATGLVLVQALLLHPDSSSVFLTGRFGFGHLLTGISYLAVAAFLLGCLAEEGGIHRAEVAAMGRFLSGIQEQTGFGGALRLVAEGLLEHHRADRLLLVGREAASGRSIVWKAEAAAGGLHQAVVRVSQHTDQEVDSYLFPAPGEAWALVRSGRESRTVTALARDGQVLPENGWNVPAAFWQAHEAGAAAAVAIALGGDWEGRLFVLRDRPFSATEVRFLQRAAGQILPAVHDHYLLRRPGPRVSARERRRLARKLRDGLVRSLSGLEVQMAATRKSLAERDPMIDMQLQRIQVLLGVEAQAVRDLMQQIRPFDGAPDQVLDAFESLVERFGRETGIASRFWSDVDEVYLAPKTARELARALREALGNVHKHSGAKQVDVRFSGDEDSWRLAIFNDGRPFGWQGRYTLRDLDTLQRGPRVMKARVREMRGDLTIESSASGVRIDIIVPRAQNRAAS